MSVNAPPALLLAFTEPTGGEVSSILRPSCGSWAASAPAQQGRGGFTLIELLITIAIMLILMGMLMPLITQARRASMRTITRSILVKTETALKQYKADFHGYPYQASYPTTEPCTSWTNTLNYNLGTTIAQSDEANVRADMATAAAQYTYDITNYMAHGFNNNGVVGLEKYPPVKGSVQTFTENRGVGPDPYNWGSGWPVSDLAPVGTQVPEGQSGTFFMYDTETWTLNYGQWYSIVPPTCVLLNRMGAERASELMLIGDVNACGVTMPAVTYAGMTHTGRDLSSIPLVASPASAARPGWANDYLQGQIEAKYLSGSAILDAWYHPLIYVCQVLPGCEGRYAQINGWNADVPDNELTRYGLEPSVTGETVPGPVLPYGRQTIEPCYTDTETPIAGDSYLPNPSDLMHSDRRYWAAPGYELEFELWSAGPDGVYSWWRDDPTNLDNVSCEPYDATIGIQPP